MKQQQALAIMHSANLVLLTGAAGSGKTYILRQFIRQAKSTGQSVAVTATTGLAATHLNGITIHAWSGIGIHDQLPANHFNKLTKQRRDTIQNTDILIIDEISMLHDYRLDLVDQTCKTVRESDKPFGGLKVILCGDFFQLPPVNRPDSRQGAFITSSQSWQEYDFTVCYLSEQYRQQNDQAYTDILNGIRNGFLTRRQLDSLQARQQSITVPFSAQTRLLTTNIDVDAINLQHLNKINSDGITYSQETTGSKKYVQQLKNSCLAPEVLELKKGAHVMCIKNSPDKKFVNGSLGIVQDFEPETLYPIVQLNNGRKVTIKPDTWELVDGDKKRASLTQLPLRLAWAITVHKSQGMTLDSASIDLSRAFVEGMGYVALSRVTSMDALVLEGLNAMALKVSAQAKLIDTELQARSDQALIDFGKDISNWQKQQSKINRQIENNKQDTPKSSWADKLAYMRQKHPNAYKPWSEDDDKKLVSQFSNGKNIIELSHVLGRHSGSIKARLQKHFGEDIFN
jgi:ATP-dependent exoDNAse (exonuclease V) alpha subunit